MDLQSSDYEPILHDTIYQTGDPYISKLDKTDLIFHTNRKCITCKVTQHPQTCLRLETAQKGNERTNLVTIPHCIRNIDWLCQAKNGHA